MFNGLWMSLKKSGKPSARTSVKPEKKQRKGENTLKREKRLKKNKDKQGKNTRKKTSGILRLEYRWERKILAALKPLLLDREIVNTITREYSDRNRVIHQRILTDHKEYQDTMPLDRTVTEMFLINRNNELVYTQIWAPKQWAEAIGRFWETSGHRIKLAKPSDFKILNTSTVQSLHESVKHGKHIDTLAESLRNEW